MSAAEQRLLRHLAIFSAGFTVEAAAAVVNDGGAVRSSVMEGIANLVAKSLVVLDRDTAARWYLLDTIRAYGLEKLDGHGERDSGGAAPGDVFSRSFLAVSGSIRCRRFRRTTARAGFRKSTTFAPRSTGASRPAGTKPSASTSPPATALGTSLDCGPCSTTDGGWQSLDLLTKAARRGGSLDDLRCSGAGSDRASITASQLSLRARKGAGSGRAAFAGRGTGLATRRSVAMPAGLWAMR